MDDYVLPEGMGAAVSRSREKVKMPRLEHEAHFRVMGWNLTRRG
jgi:hypothetical protein